MLRTVLATRYVTPLREGGSLPGVVEAEDEGLYVVKFRGAGQGTKVLVAELLGGALAQAAGLKVPERVLMQVDLALGRAEPDPEIRELLKRSAGLNLALDFLPGSMTFDPVAGPIPSATVASRIVLLDAFILNVDRTPKNPNLLSWHQDLWLIDHGAALYFHHGWTAADRLVGSRSPFAPIKDHVLLPWASGLRDAAVLLQSVLTDAWVERTVASIPDDFLPSGEGFETADEHRSAYAVWLRARRDNLNLVLEEAERARALLV